MSFKSYDADLYNTDAPFDELALQSVADGHRANWDLLQPVVTADRWCADSDGTVTDEDDILTSADWACLLCVPWFVQPGDATITVWVYAQGQNSATGPLAPYLRAYEGPSAPSNASAAQSIDEARVYQLGGGFQWIELTLPLKPTDTARFTFIQVWYKSDLGKYAVDGNAYTTAGWPEHELSVDGRFVLDDATWWAYGYPSNYNPRYSIFYRARPATAADVAAGLATTAGDFVVVDAYKLVSYREVYWPAGAGSGTDHKVFEVFPSIQSWPQEDSMSTGWFVHDVVPLYVRTIALQVTRESSAPPSRLVTAPDSQTVAGQLPRSEMMLKMLSGEERLRNIKRPLAIAPVPTEAVIAAQTHYQLIQEFGAVSVSLPITRRFPYAEYYYTSSGRTITKSLDEVFTVNVQPDHTRVLAIIFLTAVSPGGYNAAVGARSPNPNKARTVDVTMSAERWSGGTDDLDPDTSVTVSDVTVPAYNADGSCALKYMDLSLGHDPQEMSEADVNSLLDPAYVKMLRLELTGIAGAPMSGDVLIYYDPLHVRIQVAPDTTENLSSRVYMLACLIWSEP